MMNRRRVVPSAPAAAAPLVVAAAAVAPTATEKPRLERTVPGSSAKITQDVIVTKVSAGTGQSEIAHFTYAPSRHIHCSISGYVGDTEAAANFTANILMSLTKEGIVCASRLDPILAIPVPCAISLMPTITDDRVGQCATIYVAQHPTSESKWLLDITTASL